MGTASMVIALLLVGRFRVNGATVVCGLSDPRIYIDVCQYPFENVSDFIGALKPGALNSVGSLLAATS